MAEFGRAEQTLARGRVEGFIMLRVGRDCVAGVAAAIVVALSSPSANAQSMADKQRMADKTPVTYAAADVFSAIIANDFALLERADFSALAYAKSQRSGTAGPARWLIPPPMPAVDGINGKIDAYGGGASHASGLYGGDGSLSLPLAQQYGLQIDAGAGSFSNSGTAHAGGHLFWRDPSIGLIGAYGSYAHWNGVGGAFLPRSAVAVGRFAPEVEYYWNRWTFRGIAGYETVRVDRPVVPGVPAFSIPNRFFDAISASYYVTDNFKLSIGHLYTAGRNALALGAEYGLPLGGGRMATLFAEGVSAEGGVNIARAGIRVYFGQRDKTLIDRNRQDDPDPQGGLLEATVFLFARDFLEDEDVRARLAAAEAAAAKAKEAAAPPAAPVTAQAILQRF